MYTLISDSYQYTIIDFDNALWFNDSRWESDLTTLFSSPKLLTTAEDSEDPCMSDYSNIEAWISAVTADPDCVDPYIVCHFDSLETFIQDHPEYLI